MQFSCLKNKKLIGNEGELLACSYLALRGYKILGRNIRTPFGEIDILAQKNDVLICTEVKRRVSFAGFNDDDQRPAEAVTRTKMTHITRSFSWEIARRNWNGPIQIDVICVLGNTVTAHIQNLELA